MRGGDEIALFHGQIVDGNDRKIAAQRLPVGAVVERHPHSPFSSCIKKPGALRVLAQNTRELGRWDSIGDEGPGGAVVGGPVQVRLHVVELVPVGGDVSRSRSEVRRVDHRDARPLRQSRRRNVLPGFAGITRHMHQPIIRSGPNQSWCAGRFGDGEHCGVVFDRRLILGNRSAGRTERARIVSGEVGADWLERLAFIVGLEDHAAADVHAARIVRRDHDGKGPLKSVFRVDCVVAHWVVWPRIHVALEAGLDVFSRQQAPVRSGKGDVGSIRNDGDVPALAPANVIPITDVDAAGLAARPAQRRVVLLRAADAIREMIGGDDVIELRRCLILLRPGAAAVERHVGAAVVALDHALRVVGRDPEVVVVAVRDLDVAEGFAVVRRTVHAGVQHVH